MIAVDTNILVYAYDRAAPDHESALGALAGLVDGGRAWAIPWMVAGEFYAVLTNTRRWRGEPRREDAVAALDAWIGAGARLLGEHPQQWPILRELLLSARPVGPHVQDARIAAVCQAAGVSELWSADRDFGRYPGLRVSNPLVG